MKAYHRRRRERNAYALRPRQPNAQALDRDRRRRPAAPTPWQGRMRALQDELHRNDPHANSMEIFLIYPDDLPGLMFSSNPQNLAIVRGTGQWLEETHEAKPPLLCATCDRELADFRTVEAFVVGRSPFAQRTGHMLISGICTECVKLPPEELLDAYSSGLKKIGLARDKLQHGTS
jgi:hypothetical protein